MASSDVELGVLPASRQAVINYAPLEVVDLEAAPEGRPMGLEDTVLRGKEHPDNLNYRSVFALGQVTIRIPAPPLLTLAELIGFIPWIVPATLTILMLTTRRAVYIYACVVLLITSFVNEGLFKRLFGQARPPQSACEGPGMPSGHCITSGVLCTWFFLESTALFLSSGGASTSGNVQEMLIRILIILVVFGPVPWARWYTWDHTVEQVLVGSLCGLFLGCLAFAFRIEYIPNMEFVWTPTTVVTTATPIITV
ncbi:5 transmembrane domain protein, putative [Perkinsus marinus ATCC 50983]|uniref:5 transmembrane domain protein, putative n=1 Tax=Perkinsus marinus (strain ATCC 50983 / TXsc) TaxID=423536 RepID=C5L804_PERM5|nr:5 transmembrane domain protein, putative [Perkinsus marinus ATCC 50983]EER07150.1 5 transmembrane domain protein, putative [Perkinsus marinus ATCC 50983]|eukprot:XP_002775334.1 5 transmembrane domain protein, putative [Perkinsus marinus ATCC 50983]